ncbi:uncharacterized protein [Physcomitrium patens]|nr:lysophosphatidic acid phosphatase type 6-like isoform X3 [Physcomitrium patens]|eukprot:XP_024376431.1 lysophosphatidic acid phosphatase type 6-like isoform X3 [Physcomitrella patens]
MDAHGQYPPPPAASGPQLLEVHVFFRHGDRTPTPVGRPKNRSDMWSSRVQEVPLPLRNGKFFRQKYPWGNLTTKGAQQARDLGAWLREHYVPQFSNPVGKVRLQEAPEKFISLRTTSFLRTNLTAWFLLEGLLESPDDVASIPFICREEKDENLYHNDEHCPRLWLKWEQAWVTIQKATTSDGMNWRERFQDMQAAMARELELNLDDPGFLLSMDGPGFPWITVLRPSNLQDTLECGRCHGDALPAGISVEKLTAVRTHLARDYAVTFQDRDVLQLSIGRLVRELKEALLDRVNTEAQSTSDRPSLFLYSGHDATIMPLSVALGLPWTEWPGYTSSICVELWRGADGEGGHAVRVLFDREEVALPISRDGSAPKKVLSFHEFLEIAEWSSLSETDFSSRCQDGAEIADTHE